MSERLGIGMIGCGEIAVATAQGIVRSEHARIVRVMDVDAGVAADLGARHGVPHTTDLEELLDDGAVQAVYIAVPHYLHAELALRALAAGKHVLVEKPIATTLADADAMLAAAARAGRGLSVAFHAQVSPSLRRVRALVTAGTIGKVMGTRIVYRGCKPPSYWQSGWTGRIRTDWRPRKAEAGGGVLIMNIVHNLNTMRYLTGLEVTRVAAEYDTFVTPVEVEDLIALTYRYHSGAIGTVEAGSALPGRDPLHEVDRIYGETGQIILAEPAPLIYPGRDGNGLKAGEWQTLAAAEEDERAMIVEGFARAVLSGEPPPVSGADGRAALEIILAAYRAGAEGRVVTLPLA
ncbi:MAG: Gfo/Idh/MocA family oxidoreductase [Chloroflexota bacterium]